MKVTFLVVLCGISLAFANPKWTITPRGDWKDLDHCFDVHSHNGCADMNKIVANVGFAVKCMWCSSHTNQTSKYHPDHCAPYAAVTTGAYALDEMVCDAVRKSSHHSDEQASSGHGRKLLGLELSQLLKGIAEEDPYGGKMGGGGMGGGMMGGGKMGGGSMGGGSMGGGSMGGGSMGGGSMGGGKTMPGGNGGKNMGGGGAHTGVNGGAHTGAATGAACKNANSSNPLACYDKGLQFLGGLAFGTVGLDPTRVLKCGGDITPVVTELETTFKGFHLSVSSMVATVKAISDTVNGVKTAINDCQLGKLKQSLTQFVDHFKGVVKAGITATSILANGVELFNMVDDGVHAAEAGNLYEVGLDVGKVINVIIGN